VFEQGCQIICPVTGGGHQLKILMLTVVIMYDKSSYKGRCENERNKLIITYIRQREKAGGIYIFSPGGLETLPVQDPSASD